NDLTQEDNKRVDSYTYKFQCLLTKVDPNNNLLASYVIKMFLSGLHSKIATYLSISEPNNLTEAIAGARKLEAGNHYKKKNIIKSTYKIEKEIEDLNKRINQIASGYERLTMTLAARAETTPQPNQTRNLQPHPI